MVYSAGLENQSTRKGTVGSNPTPTVYKKVRDESSHLRIDMKEFTNELSCYRQKVQAPDF